VNATPVNSPWRVTFHDSQTFAEEFDRNLVKGGLFVPTDMLLRVRAVVDFLLVVPFSQEEIAGRGEVIYVIDQKEAARRGCRAGVGLQLVEFDMDTAKEARRVIAEVLTQSALRSPEQRAFARIPARLKVHYQSGVWDETAVTRDISKSGLFLCTPRALSHGSTLQLALIRSARGQDLVLESEVVRTDMSAPPEPRPEGVGLVFREQNVERRRRTERFVTCLDLRRRSLTAPELRGQLDEAGVENVIRIFGKSGRDGELVLRNGPSAGKIAFQGGRVVRAELPSSELFGPRAFFQMMTWEGGDFEYHARRVHPAPGLNHSPEDLLRDGRGLKAQTVEWRRRMPGNRRLMPGPRFDPSALCVPVEALPLVEVLHSRPCISEVLSRLGSSDLEAYRLIETLCSRGLVRLD
jgi:Tfp pilus assembly protein PilZ